VGSSALQGAKLVRARNVEPHPSACEADASTLAWAARFGLVKTAAEEAALAARHCGSYAAHTYASAPADVIELGAQLTAWLFCFEQTMGAVPDLDALPAAFAGFEALLFSRAQPVAVTPLHSSLADLRTRLVQRAADVTWPQRFAYSLRRSFDGYLLAFPYRRTTRTPSLSVYRSVRRWSAGVLPVLDLVELALPRRLTSEMASKRQLWELRDQAALLCAWAHDLYAFEGGESERLNLVSVLRHERQLTDERALQDAVAIHNADVTAFDQVQREYVDDPGTSALERSYLEGVSDWIHGNHIWSRSAQRYRQPLP
jgi:hypothetical protein